MADTEFEEFRQAFEKLPQNLKAPAPYYSLVPLNLEEEYPSSKSDSSDQEDDKLSDISLSQPQPPPTHVQPISSSSVSATATTLSICNISNTINNNHINNNHNNSDVGGSGVGGVICNNSSTNGVGSDNVNDTTNHLEKPNINSFPHLGCFERKRRKLPEIPKLRKPLIFPFANGSNVNNHSSSHSNGMTSLADELGSCGVGGGIGTGGGIGISGGGHNSRPMNFNSSFSQRSLLTLKCSYLLDEDSSPDSERLHSLGDVDSGHSTSHSPNDFKSMSPQMASSPSSPFPPPFGGVPMSQLEMLEATHRGLHKFIPRHHDEIEIEIGDPIYVQKEADDLWCEGVNLRTGRQGIFPSAYAVDLDYNDFDPSSSQVKKERYLLGYLGSVETVAHKGTGVVCQAVRKICGEYGDSPKAQPCILEVSDQGLRMVDRSKPQKREKGACIDYFYSLKNVSFCAFHPRDHRYIGFITKHPTVQRFACHVFKGHESTRPVAEAVGRAFHRFYQKFIETAYPIEDIYIE